MAVVYATACGNIRTLPGVMISPSPGEQGRPGAALPLQFATYRKLWHPHASSCSLKLWQGVGPSRPSKRGEVSQRTCQRQHKKGCYTASLLQQQLQQQPERQTTSWRVRRGLQACNRTTRLAGGRPRTPSQSGTSGSVITCDCSTSCRAWHLRS